MNLSEAITLIPENDRRAVITEVQKAKSAEDIEAIVKRYDLDADAQEIYNELTSTEIDEDDLKKVAGGCFQMPQTSCSSTF